MALATLSIDLVAKLAKLEADLGKAAYMSQKTANKMEAAFSGVKNVIAGLGIAGAITGLEMYFRTIVDGMNALKDLSDATGSTVSNISALEDIAAKTGTSFDTVGTALVKFNAALNAASPNSDAELALRSIGLEASKLKQLDPAEALLQTAQAMDKFADDGNKARLAQTLFGKSLREVSPFLKDLAEQGKLVGKVTDEQARAAERFNDQLATLKKLSTDTARSLASELVPALNNLLTNYIAFKEQGLLGTILADAAKDVVGLGQLTANAGADINRLIKQRDELLAKRLPNGGFSQGVAEDLDRVEKLLKISRIRQKTEVDGMTQDYSDAVSRRFQRDKPAVKLLEAPKETKQDIDEAARALAAFVDGLEKNLDVNKNLKEEEKALNFLRTIGKTGEIQQVRELVIGLGQQLDREKELAEALERKREAAAAAGDEVNKANEEYQALLKRLLDATPTAKLEDQRKDVRALTDEFEAGRISEAQYLEAVAARLDLTAEKTKEAKSAAEELGMTFSSAFEDAIVNGKAFSEVLQSLEKDIVRIITRKMVTEPLAEKLMGSLPDFGGGLTDIFSGIFGRASGGPVAAGNLYRVNENGPELLNIGSKQYLMMGNQSGSVTPNNALGASSSGGLTVNNNFTINGPVDRRSQQQIAAMVGVATQRATARNT